MSDEQCGGCDAAKKMTPEEKAKKRDEVLAKLPVAVTPQQKQGLGGLAYGIIPKDKAEVHPDGSIEYQADFPNPPCPNGYEPVTTHLFRPLWNDCIARMQGLKHMVDGSIEVKMLCNHRQHDLFQRFITVDACLSCPLRKVRENTNVDQG
jgi:hypothetical protein